MNEAIIENYLDTIQSSEPEYMTEGLREFLGRVNKSVFHNTVEKLHRAFSKGDAQAFESFVKQTSDRGKLPKYKEVKNYMGNFSEENPEFGKAADLAKRVIKNTYKIKDKAKLEIMSNAVAMTSWVKSKGGRTDVMTATKTNLHNINNSYSNIYDTGLQNMQASTPEEEEFQKKMTEAANKQEKIEMILVAVIIAILAGAIIWAGIAIWGFFTSPAVVASLALFAFLGMIFKVLLWGVGIATTIVVPTLLFLKAKGG